MPGPIVLGGNLVIATGISFEINGSSGTPGQVLTTSGAGLYWANSANVGGSSLLAGDGLFANATHYSVLANTGIIANSTGTFVNSSYISTLTVNSSVYLSNSSGTLANIASWVTGNAATAYSNAVANAAAIYQTTAGLSANVLVLTSNAAGFLGNSSGTLANIASWVTGNAATAYSNSTTFSSNATNLTSGTVATARLGSGTANSTTILYGNNVWAAAPSGVNTAASFVWTNTHTFSANISLSNTYLSQTILKGYKEFVTNTTIITTSQTLDLSTTNIFNLVLNNNPIALTFSNPPPAGTMYTFTLVLTQDSIGSRTVTYPANATTVCKFTDNLTPVLSTGAGKTDFVQFLTYDGGNTYFGALSIANT